MSVKPEFDYGRLAWTYKADVPAADGDSTVYRSPPLFTTEADAKNAGECGLDMTALDQRALDEKYDAGRRLIIEEIRDEYGADLNEAIRLIRELGGTAEDVARSLALLCELCEIPVEPQPEAES